LFDRNASQIGKISGVTLTYTTGEEIRKGDRVLFHGEPGEIELVADPVVSDPETAWYVQKYERGVMILEPKYFGRAFSSDPRTDCDLEFVARRN
jgi:hypothetical protein